MKKKLLITDLDNTLYDWVTFYAKSFSAMVSALGELTGIERSRIISDFKIINQLHGSSEHPFAALDLPCVQSHFASSDRAYLGRKLDPAFHEFNRVRKLELKLYPSVLETLEKLSSRGVTIIAHTESMYINAHWRIARLSIEDFFRRIYTLEGKLPSHPFPGQSPAVPMERIVVVPKEERKPNPDLLRDICAREGYAPEEAVYIGDSLVRDVGMAKLAGVTAVWAKYGTLYDRSLWDILVSVTHWSPEDVQREQVLRSQFNSVEPDFEASSFEEIKALF